MIRGFEFGWAKGVQDEQCAKKVDVASRMLCGREVGFVPVAGQPEFAPSNLHEECRRLLFGPSGHLTRRSAEVVYGTCPACGEQAPLFDGLIQAHGDACVGINMQPKRGGR